MRALVPERAAAHGAPTSQVNYAPTKRPNGIPRQVDPASALFCNYSLTQRTETVICFWPWG
jgi:hypothetical protein